MLAFLLAPEFRCSLWAVFRIGEFEQGIERSVTTVRWWVAEGRVTACRVPTGQRFVVDHDGQIDRVESGSWWWRIKIGWPGSGLSTCNMSRARNGCTIVTADQESLSAGQEFVEDLQATVRTFSGRVYGLRRYEKSRRIELTGGAW